MNPYVISVIGLGYVGLTTAIAFGRIGKVIAFDINKKRINELKNNIDKNEEISEKTLKSNQLKYTSNPNDLSNANIYIICVPTPLDKTKHPNMLPLLHASKLIGKYLKKHDIVVYESTVYPGATEEVCIPELEKISKMLCGKDFNVGFSPERVNPADKEHTFETITKIVSATNKKTLNILVDLYSRVVKAGVFPVSSIRVAEACKVIENTQRDINIAFMNDIAIMLHHLNIDLKEVMKAMETKWNYLPFKPGLVGGHCIGINSYYLMHKANELGYSSEIITSGRKVNEFLANFIVYETIKKLIELDIPIKRAKVGILGITYKEDCSDIRDTRVIDIIKGLQSFNIEVVVHDPIADPKITKQEYKILLQDWSQIKNLDAIIVAVSHTFYKKIKSKELIKKLNYHGIVMDLKEIFEPNQFSNTGVILWRL